MSEPQERDYGREPRRPFRRKRRYQGATWAPPSMSADVGDGLWCRVCKLRHGYQTLGIQYEKRSAGWVILWNCPKTGNVLGETPLDANRKSDADATERTGTPEPGRPE